MASILKRHNKGTINACVERVSAFPGEGVVSAFSFGKGYGIWLGLITMIGWSLTLVAPQTWKKVMMHDMNKDKDASRLRALQLHPQLSDQLSRKKDHNDIKIILPFNIRTTKMTEIVKNYEEEKTSYNQKQLDLY